MQQLTGLDASFLYLETANAPMHIAGLGIYDPSTAPDGKVRFKQILDNVKERSKQVPSMTNTLVTVPMQLDHPYWKTDGGFDPEFHVRHIALPKPGDWRQLCILVSRLHARVLDRKRPLWEMYVIEGLDKLKGYPKGCFAVFTKVHHAAIDGASGVEMAAAIHDLTPDYAKLVDNGPVTVDRDPTSMELLVRAQINRVKYPFRFLSVARNTMPGIARLVNGLNKGKFERVKHVPRTRFNTNVSPHRVFDVVSFDFQDFRIIKSAVKGATINDVSIAVCGGALRKYLEAKGELGEHSLVAMAPINIRTEDQKSTGGNQVSQMTVKLCTQIADPLERLLAVNAGTRNAKELTNAIGAKTMTDYTQFMPSTLTGLAARLSSSMSLANRMSPTYNCVLTNVPGPQIPLYFTGAKLLSNFGTGPALDGVGLFQAISSYCGTIAISFTSCRDMIPDPGFYAQCIQESFDELKAAAGKASKSKPAGKRAKRSAAKTAPKAKRKSKAKTKSKAVKVNVRTKTKAKTKSKPKRRVAKNK